MDTLQSKLQEIYQERKDNNKKIENYEDSNIEESLSDLTFKDVRLGGKVEAIKEVKSHNNRINDNGNLVNKDNPFDKQAAISELHSHKKELLNRFEQMFENGQDQDQLNEARGAIEAVSGKIEALKELQKAEDKQGRSVGYKEARTFEPQNTPNIQTKTNTKKDNSIMGTDSKILGKAKNFSKESDPEVSGADFFRAMHDKPRNQAEKAAITNATTSSGFSLPETVSEQLIDQIRLRMPIIEAGGQSVMLDPSAKHTFVRINNDPVAEFKEEYSEQALDETDVFDGVTLGKSTLRVVTELSREVIQDSGQQAGAAIMMALAGSISDMITKSAFVSQGAFAPTGLDQSVSAVETFTNGGSANIGNLINAKTALFEQNVRGEDQVLIQSPKMYQDTESEQDANGRYQSVPQSVREMEKHTSSALNPGEGYVADWSNCLFGFGSNIEIEAYPGVSSQKYAMRYLSHVRFDFVCLRPKAFIRIEEASS